MKFKHIVNIFVYILAAVGLVTLLDNSSPILVLMILIGLGASLITLVTSRFKNNGAAVNETLPTISDEKEKHYQELGLNNEQMSFFRETMAQAKKQIVQLETNMNQVAKLKAIDLRNDTLKAAKSMFKELVKEPQKLHQADRFLYNHLPNLVDLTNKYIEINEHELKNKNTFETLAKSAEVIDEVSQLLVSDYQRFVSDDLAALDIEISLAKQYLDRERMMQEDEALKNEEKEF